MTKFQSCKHYVGLSLCTQAPLYQGHSCECLPLEYVGLMRGAHGCIFSQKCLTTPKNLKSPRLWPLSVNSGKQSGQAPGHSYFIDLGKIEVTASWESYFHIHGVSCFGNLFFKWQKVKEKSNKLTISLVNNRVFR